MSDDVHKLEWIVNSAFTKAEIDAHCVTLSGPILDRLWFVRRVMGARGFASATDKADLLNRLTTLEELEAVEEIVFC